MNPRLCGENFDSTVSTEAAASGEACPVPESGSGHASRAGRARGNSSCSPSARPSIDGEVAKFSHVFAVAGMVGSNSAAAAKYRALAVMVAVGAAILAAGLPTMAMAKVNYSRYKVFRIRPESEKRQWLTEKLEMLGESKILFSKICGFCRCHLLSERGTH